MTTGMTSAAPTRVLVVAHRTAATPRLLDEVRARARRSSCTFTLLVPRPYWDPETDEAAATLELAIPLLDEAAGGGTSKGASATTIRSPPYSRRSSEAASTRSSSPPFRRAPRAGSVATSPTAWRRSACPSRWSPPSSPSAPSPTLAEPRRLWAVERPAESNRPPDVEHPRRGACRSDGTGSCRQIPGGWTPPASWGPGGEACGWLGGVELGEQAVRSWQVNHRDLGLVEPGGVDRGVYDDDDDLCRWPARYR